MRIRWPFFFAFVLLLLVSSSLGLLPHSTLPQPPSSTRKYIPPQSDKALHFLSFLFLTITFYFILDTSRRRLLHLTLFVCTLGLGVGSEVVQGALPNGREFDGWDVLANVVGSLCGVAIANAYSRRAAERRRLAKYGALAGEDAEDLELGEGPGPEGGTGLEGLHVGETNEGQQTGVVSTARTVEEELDNWDENVPDDWDPEDEIERDSGETNKKMTPASSSAGEEDATTMVAGGKAD